jgi:hypothetical protein
MSRYLVERTFPNGIFLPRPGQNRRSRQEFIENNRLDGKWGIEGMAKTADESFFVDEMLRSTIGSGDFLDPYWDWIKNQLEEPAVDYGGVIGTPCQLELALLNLPERFDYTWNPKPWQALLRGDQQHQPLRDLRIPGGLRCCAHPAAVRT